MATQVPEMGARTKTKATRTQLLRLVERQQYKCAISGMDLDPNDSSLDHIIPVSKGGGHEIENLQIVTGQVNRMKGNMTMEEFIDVCKRAVSVYEAKQANSCDTPPAGCGSPCGGGQA